MVAGHRAVARVAASLRGSWPEHGSYSCDRSRARMLAGSCSNSSCGSIGESCIPNVPGTLAKTTKREATCKRGREGEDSMNFGLVFTPKL